jgi:hypothetical protein
MIAQVRLIHKLKTQIRFTATICGGGEKGGGVATVDGVDGGADALGSARFW